MGKKRIIKKSGELVESVSRDAIRSNVSSKKKFTEGVIHIHSTYNNTLVSLADINGNIILQHSCGRSGFSGSKKGTPYAASKAAEILADEAREMGVSDISVRINGVGAGRESALRMFAQKGFSIHSIKDVTPVPHGHIKPVKPRRV